VGQAGSWRPNDAQLGWIIENRAALHPNRNLDFTFVDFHLPVRDLVDPAWLVPSEKLAEVCTPTGAARNRGPRWLFTADRSGLARDRAAKYQVAVRELAAARRWSILPPKAVVAGFPRTRSRRAPSSSVTSMPPSWRQPQATRS
jgi:hypothetical protein